MDDRDPLVLRAVYEHIKQTLRVERAPSPTPLNLRIPTGPHNFWWCGLHMTLHFMGPGRFAIYGRIGDYNGATVVGRNDFEFADPHVLNEVVNWLRSLQESLTVRE